MTFAEPEQDRVANNTAGLAGDQDVFAVTDSARRLIARRHQLYESSRIRTRNLDLALHWYIAKYGRVDQIPVIFDRTA
jgi:hypothetical protein